MNYKKLLISLIILFTFVQAQNPLQNQILDSAMQAMHDLNYDQSLEIFNQMEDNIYAPIGKLLVEWYQMMGLYGNEFNKKILSDKCTDLSEFYKEKLKNDSKNPDLNFCMALAIGFKSRIIISDKSTFFVMLNGVNSLKYLRRVDKYSIDNPDLKFCQGVFDYYTAEYPGILKSFARLLLNTSGDRSIGVNKIEAAAAGDGFLKYDANFMLAFIHLYIENKPEKAKSSIDFLTMNFPNNPNYHFLSTLYYIQMKNIKAAEYNFDIYMRSINPKNPYYKNEFNNRTDFLKAMIAVNKSDFITAEKYFKSFAEHYILELEHLRAIALLEEGKNPGAFSAL